MKRIAALVTSLTLPAAVFVSCPAAAAGNIHLPFSTTETNTNALTVKLFTPNGVTPSIMVKTPAGKTPLSSTTTFTFTAPGMYKVSAKKVITADGVYTPRVKTNLRKTLAKNTKTSTRFIVKNLNRKIVVKVVVRYKKTSSINTPVNVPDDDMKTEGYFNHVSLDGTEFDGRIKKSGYKGDASAENIASGQVNAQAVLASWLASPAHCVNIMDGYSTDVGYGKAEKKEAGYTVPNTWWVADFGRS